MPAQRTAVAISTARRQRGGMTGIQLPSRTGPSSPSMLRRNRMGQS